MEKFDPHSKDWLLNKFEIYKELRNRNTAYWSEKYKMYVITRYDDVFFALNNHDIFSSAKGNLLVEDPMRFGMTLGASDNPNHEIYKNIVKNAYSKENIKRIADCVSEKANELLTSNPSNISEIIEELSAWTTTEILNLPYDKTSIKDLIVDIQRHSPPTVSENIDSASYDRFRSILMLLLSIEKAQPTGPGIYYEFVKNNPDKKFIISLFTGPTISGTSSLTGSLEFLTLDLFRENQLDAILADRSLIPQAINESLRFHASTGRFSRTVIKEVTLHGIDLKPGDRIAVCLESANRDPKVFENPDQFLLTRNTSKHLGWGHGIHACIALAISKAMMSIYLETLLNKFGKYKITTKQEDFKYVMTASGNDDMISNIWISTDKGTL